MLRTRHTIRKRNTFQLKILLLLLVGIMIVYFLFRALSPSVQSEAYKAVDQFYKLEQESNFASSWELFHPYMKSKFDKNHYIQDRNHVFMQHFGVKTFDYKIGDPEKISDWSISNPPELPLIDTVYKFPVTQHYKSKFGTFEINQDVFATKHEGEWLIVWSYQ